MFGLFAIIGLLLSLWEGLIHGTYQKQILAIRQIEALGGRAVAAPQIPPRAPWIVRATGRTYHLRVGQVYLHGPRVRDDHLRLLLPTMGHWGYAGLGHLSLQETGVTDAGLGEIAHFTDLKTVYLDGASITDAGIASLTTLHLSRLGLSNCDISDEAIPYLSEMVSLRRLDIESTRVTCSGVEMLRERLPDTVVLWSPIRTGTMPR